MNGQRQAVLSHDGGPAMWLATGSYEIAGRIPWHDRPQSLHVPAAIGLVALSVDGKTVAPVQRDEDAVTLGRGAAAAPEADSLDLRVFRLLVDGVPAELTTQIRLAVSGQAREEILGPVLPAGFAAIALEGEWPARLDNDGRLHVQVQPGSADADGARTRVGTAGDRRRARARRRRGRSRKSGATSRRRVCA